MGLKPPRPLWLEFPAPRWVAERSCLRPHPPPPARLKVIECAHPRVSGAGGRSPHREKTNLTRGPTVFRRSNPKDPRAASRHLGAGILIVPISAHFIAARHFSEQLHPLFPRTPEQDHQGRDPHRTAGRQASACHRDPIFAALRMGQDEDVDPRIPDHRATELHRPRWFGSSNHTRFPIGIDDAQGPTSRPLPATPPR